MEFQLPINIPPLAEPIRYGESIMLVGSCFTEHIGNRLDEYKFDVHQNPHGILFDPQSVATSLHTYIDHKKYTADDLFYLNEVWQSWQHHGAFSDVNADASLERINASQERAHHFLRTARWLVITLGSSFSYRLTGEAGAAGEPVANCHRAPGQWFAKHMMTIGETTSVMETAIHALLEFNPQLRIIFTVSPVRHIRDGVTENNRSKARLIEVVHHLAAKFSNIYYFPAYELVIDVLRDYRFYDIDMVHPNYAATAFVMEKFVQSCMDRSTQSVIEEVKQLVSARKHRPMHPATAAHRQFLQTHLQKAQALAARYPFLRLDEEIAYFKK